jgi:tRNA pseudouridine55 synthase
MTEDIPEILLVDKPKGITSFDVIRILRKKLNIKKIGHAGTLDPMATGLMILGVGKGTKKLTDYIKLDKTYEARVLIGQKTITGDLEGEVIEEKLVVEQSIDENLVKTVLNDLIGEIQLQVPRFSAIKIKGKKLYEKARKGEAFEAPTRLMKIYKIELQKLNFKDDKLFLDLIIDVGTGAYIRSIAEEIGNRLGYPSTLAELRRTRVGAFGINDAIEINSTQSAAD